MKKYILILSLVLFLVIGCQQQVPSADAEQSSSEQPAEQPAEASSEIQGAAVAETAKTTPAIVMKKVSILGKEGFEPAELSLKTGDSLVWANEDAKSMVLTFQKDKGRDISNSELILPEATYSRSFDEPGTYEYWTTAYGVKGKVIVEE